MPRHTGDRRTFSGLDLVHVSSCTPARGTRSFARLGMPRQSMYTKNATLFEHRPIIAASDRIALGVFTKALLAQYHLPTEFAALMW